MTKTPALPETTAAGEGVAAPRPQDDLYRHINAGWLAETEIPDDKSQYSTFTQLRDASELACRELVEQAPTGAATSLLGELYASFMDTDEVEGRGLDPIAGPLAAAREVSAAAAMMRAFGASEREGVPGAFAIYVDLDPADPDRYVLNLYQGGLGLPDESYYREDSFAGVREQYVRAVTDLFALAGLDDAAARAQRVMALETELAGAHWDRVRCRDRSQTFNPASRQQLDQLIPAELWEGYLSGLGAAASALEHTVVAQPSYFSALAGLLTAGRFDSWRDHLAWNIIRSFAPVGPQALAQRHFDFYGTVLSGTPVLRERWKRGVEFVQSCAGEELGRAYVQRHFPPASKRRMDDLVANLIHAYRRSIGELAWMTDATKAAALEKLAMFTPKIGYPAKWRDYTGLLADRKDLAGNARRAAAFACDYELDKLGAPVDRDEWHMTPQTVNAYYYPAMNEIVFPAAILHAPFFDPQGSDAANYGAIGAVIGHEIGHGFDDQGSKFDGRGMLRNWWTDEDRQSFEALTAALIAQYSALSPEGAGGKMVNGALTIGENIGDLGGLGIAYSALRIAAGGDGEPGEIDEQTTREFFAAWARCWRAKARPEAVLQRLTIDPHSPPEFRCNQVVRNLGECHVAYGTAAGDGLWLDPAQRVRIW